MYVKLKDNHRIKAIFVLDFLLICLQTVHLYESQQEIDLNSREAVTFSKAQRINGMN